MNNLNINNPIPDEWTSYVSQVALGLNVLPGVLYSTRDYISGVTTKLTFFDYAAGNRTDLTNMEREGSLPNPESFLVQAIESKFKVLPFSDDSGVGDNTALVSRFSDVVRLADGGVVTFKFGNMISKPFPLDLFCSRSSVDGQFATGSDLLADYPQLKGPQTYSVFPNMMISPNQQFSLTIEWPAGPVTLSTGAESTIPIRMLYDGQRAQAIQ